MWYRDGKLHREDGPAEIYYTGSGKIKYESWLKNGIGHRENAPAVIIYWEDGTKSKEVWKYNDKLHRTDGPAVIEYDPYENIVSKEYYIDDIKITKEEFEKYKILNNFLDKVKKGRKIKL